MIDDLVVWLRGIVEVEELRASATPRWPWPSEQHARILDVLATDTALDPTVGDDWSPSWSAWTVATKAHAHRLLLLLAASCAHLPGYRAEEWA